MTSLRDFPLVGFRTGLLVENAWNVTRAESVDVTLSRSGLTVITSSTTKSVYLVLAGDERSFRRISDDHGISIDPGSAYAIYLDTLANEQVRAEVHLLEYDASGTRTGVTTIGARHRALYLPPAGVDKVLVTVRVRGTSPLELGGLDFDAVERPVGARTGVKVVDFGVADTEHQHQAEQDLEDFARSLEDVVAAGRRAGAVLHQVQDHLVAASEPRRSGGGGSLEARRLTRELLVELASTLPQSNGSEYFSTKLPLRAAVVTDEYMLNFYKDAFSEVTYVRPSAVDQVIAEGFDLLIYVTCWKGLHDEEWRGVKFREGPLEALEKLLAFARENGRPTIFQSIEDPSNFDYFLPIARKFDHVFTSDTDCLEAYRRELGHDSVHYGEYGANPQLNNPIGSHRHTVNKAFFAGSYPKRYQERVNDMHVMFDSILSTGENLTLVDRNFGNEDYAFPEPYGELSLEPMPHDVLQRVHKLFRWSLNFNSIKSSPTMCAMRIYELQAQGRGLLSNYARSVFNRFPEIRIIADHENLESYFTAEIPLSEHRTNEAQVRSVLTSRTAQDIALRMLDAAGVDPGVPRGTPRVALVANRVDEQLRREVAAQSYPEVELIGDDADAEELLSREIRYIGRVDTEHSYGEHYVMDRINAFKYTNSDFVTQSSTLREERIDGPAHEFVQHAEPGVTLHSVRRVGGDGVRDVLRGEIPAGAQGYSLPPFEAGPRLSPGAADRVPSGVETPVLSIIVPIYNAGTFLLTKCLPSIERNARAAEFEILLVDDGSTDGTTAQTCRDLAAQDPRIRAHCFETGGSGSASRPRNKGIEMARAPRLTFLDPDNEISDGGYDVLLELLDEAQAVDPEVGFVSGYQAKVTQSTGTTGRHTQERLTIRPDLREHYFERGKFPVVSTQCAVMEKRLFDDGSLRFVERAAGQDTLFGWELMLAAQRGAFTAAAHLIYYAERDGSVTNTVDADYFRKKLIMEKAQVEVLTKYGLLESYRDHHFQNFFTNWYLLKLESMPVEGQDEARGLLRQIAELYGADATF